MSFKEASKFTTMCEVAVIANEQISPNFRRITVAGEELAQLPRHGFDHWFRLFLPQESGETNFDLPKKLGLIGYVKFMRMNSATRPYLRNYTVAEFRPDQRELDIDFVVHGDHGPASRWAQRAGAGDTVVLVDQGRGFDPDPGAAQYLLAGDETVLPAIAGILRDLPREARGLAVLEVADAGDRRELAAPAGFDIRWLVRADEHPGSLALAELKTWQPDDPKSLSAYICGEHELPVGGRRHLVSLGVPKSRIAFVGYWRQGKDAY